MAVDNAGAMRMPLSAQRTEVTLSETSLCHYITDDELVRIGEMRQDLGTEICLAASGIFFGSIIPAFDGIRRFNAEVNPSTPTDLLSMLLCAAALAISLVTGIQWFLRSRIHKDLVGEIRQRPKVSLVHDYTA